MGINTKLILVDAKFEQPSNGSLTLSGGTIIASSGDLRYAVHPTFTGNTQIVDKQYVDGVGLTKLDTATFSGYTGTTNTRLNTIESEIDYISGVTTTLSVFGTYTGATNTRLNTIEGVYVSGATGGIYKTDCHTVSLTAVNQNILSGALTGTTGSYLATSGRNVCLDATSTGLIGGAITGVTNGLTKVGNNSAKLGGTLSETTTLSGSQTLNVNVSLINLTGSTGVDITGEVRLKSTPATYNGDVLTFDPTDGSISKTTLSSLGGITGGTNGISQTGQNVCLGAPLIKDTEIAGAGFDLSLGTSGSKLDLLNVHTSGDVGITSANNLVMSLSGGTIATSDLKGLRYNANYIDTFVDSSLVSKLYVDTIATGLHPHDTVLVATTANITLSGAQTIDGIAVVAGNRVLVKDQGTAANNGIYVVAAGAWARALDFDGDPNGEVVNGDLIPVLSGNTNANTIWVLTTPDPITVGTTALNFTLFSKLLGVSAGDGIAIAPYLSTQQISVDLATNSGLEFSSGDLRIDLDANSALVLGAGGLSVNSSIAGNALDWSNGVINVNIVDINSQLGGVLSATTNGLSETTTGIVELGGALTKATTITSGEGTSLTFTDSHTTAKQGIVYGGDYSASFVNESLVTKRYVTGLTSTIAGDVSALDTRLDIIEPIYVTGATNGLSKPSAHLVELGGTLTKNTTINVSTFDLKFSGDSIQYITDYSSTYVARSLVDAAYVTGLTTTSGIQTANNGLTKVGTNVVLGGALTGSTTIEVPLNQWLCFSGVNSSFNQCNGGISIYGGDSGSAAHSVEIKTVGVDLWSCSSYITLNGGNQNVSIGPDDFVRLEMTSGFTRYCAPAVSGGIQYCEDYSANFVARSLVDAAYVTGLTTTSGIQTANNGLTKIGTNVVLGGALTGATTITGGAHNFSITSTSGNISLGNTSDSYVVISQNGDTVCLGNNSGGKIETNSNSVVLTSTYTCVATTLPTGAVTDAVLVWNSTDKQIKQIDASNLGEDNNDYSMAVVTGSTGLTTTSPYTILVNHSAAVTITLPATPFNGQAFKIKDVSSDALTYNITVSGNGNEIDKTGTTSATINTDGGAFEVVFNTALDKWFVVSFFN